MQRSLSAFQHFQKRSGIERPIPTVRPVDCVILISKSKVLRFLHLIVKNIAPGKFRIFDWLLILKIHHRNEKKK